ncbi:hypothetical protein ACNKHO_00265 [Shigella flexneri]
MTESEPRRPRSADQIPPSAERRGRFAYPLHRDAFRAGLSVDGVFDLTNIDRWFLVQIEERFVWKRKWLKWGSPAQR